MCQPINSLSFIIDMKYLFPDTRISVFTKPPVPGKCKTRLIPHLGEEGAAHLQEKLIKKIINDLYEFQLCPFDVWQSEPTEYFSCLVSNFNSDIKIHTQAGFDLGARMSNAIKDNLKISKKLIIIGSDCIEYSKAYLTSAIESLDNYDVVVGPAYDGGYVLIGATVHYPKIFQDISWGTETVLADTVSKLRLNYISFTQLKTLNDIDTPEDLKKSMVL